MNANPYLVTGADGSGVSLDPLPAGEKHFQEEWLQELVFRHPDILPVNEIDESFSPAIPLGREIAHIDDLFISPAGDLIIVETKLWRNPEAHRTVVAQVLEYARVLSTWTYRQLDAAVRAFWDRRTGRERSLYQAVSEADATLDLDAVELEQRVQDGLGKGRFALLIVGDRIYPAATQLAEVIQSAPHLQFTLAFVELACYRLDRGSDWPLIVVPRVVSRTREVTRAVVKVLYEQQKPDVEVSALEEQRSSTGKTSLAEFAASLPAELADLFRSYIQGWGEKGHTIYWGKVGFSLRVFHEEKLRTVMDAYPDTMSICQESRLERYGLPREGYSEYRSALLGSPRVAAALTTGRHYLKYDELTVDEVRLLLEATDAMVSRWGSLGAD